jgi:hypothetical protein
MAMPGLWGRSYGCALALLLFRLWLVSPAAQGIEFGQGIERWARDYIRFQRAGLRLQTGAKSGKANSEPHPHAN